MDRSLDPRIIGHRRRRTLLRGLTLLAGMVLSVWLLRMVIAPGVAREEIRTAVVGRGPVLATITANGQVVPRNERIVSALFGTEVGEVVVRAGDTVAEGDVLMRLDARSVATRVRDLEEQLALKDNQRRSEALVLEKALNEARGRQELLEIDLESRKARKQRLATLADRGAISAGELHEARLDVRRSEAELRQLERSIDNQRASARTELERIDLEASMLQNQLDEQRRLLDSARVQAPRAGVVTWILDQPGQSVTPGAALARVADLSAYRVEAQVSDFHAPRLSPGLETQIRVGDRALPGRVDAVLPTVEGGAMTLLIEFDDPEADGLRPQLRVDVEIVTGRASEALTVRNGPSIGEGGRHFVYRIVDGEAIRTAVELGMASRHQVQILSGLDEGDEVIISDISDLQHLERFKVN